MELGKRKAELSDSSKRNQKLLVEDSCEPMSHSDCQDCDVVTTSQCEQQCTATGERCKRRSIHPGTVPYCMQHISILAVRPDRWPATELDALRRAFVYVRDHVIRTSRYTTESKRKRHAMFDKAVDRLSSMSSRLFGGSRDIVTHITPFFFTFPERIDRSPTITDRDSEIVLDKILQHYDAGAPTVRQLQESHRWIDDRHFSEEQKYDASKTYFIHCHDIGHTEDIVQKFELQHVVLIGTFERWVRDGVEDKDDDIFSNFVNLRSVKFLLPWVTHIGNCWLRQCGALENPIFTGLSSLVEVGYHWMGRCDALKNSSFIGLSSLKYVGSYWMSDCYALENPSFIGLSSLEKIGSSWMMRCRRLENPSFIGLSSLLEVGAHWMAHCPTLEKPSFTGLSGLLEVGNDWMLRCHRLENPSFTGLSSLWKVGDDWMMTCAALAAPNFTGLSSLEKVGSYWMSGCDALENPSFIGLSSLKTIDSSWMSLCRALKNPSFTGLSSVTRVGPHGHITVQQYFNIYIDQF